MNIPKAIEGSQEAVTFLSIHHQPRLAKAVQLSREALKHIKDFRLTVDGEPVYLLPGETKD